VFIEKPMTCTYDEAVKLKALADVSKGNLYVRHNRRFEPAFQHVRDIIESGVLGDVFQIRLTRGGYQRRDDWQTIKEYGGGQLLNWGPHIVDHALRLLGAPVASMWSDLKRVAAVGDAEDHLRINLTGTNKRVVEVTITGGAAIGEPEYLVWGTHGSLTASGNSIRSRYLDPARLPGPLAPNPETPDGGGFGGSEVLHWVETTTTPAPKSGCDVGTSIWEALYATIRNGAPFPITLDEAVGVMKIISDAKKGTEF
jgi:predicted dehydrogenase